MVDENRRKYTYDELVDLVARLEACIAEQDKRISELERQLAAAKKTSRNSSKPPSSDITRPPGDPNRKSGRRGKRRIGGQEGHLKHESDLSVDDADHVVEYHADQLSDEGARDLVPVLDHKPRVLLQYEFSDNPFERKSRLDFQPTLA